MQPDRDWTAVLERVIAGDRLALVAVTRLVNGLLARWNAYDFRNDWEDVVQEVVASAALALREGRLREPDAAIGYLRTTTRFRFIDRLRTHLRAHRPDTIAWDEAIEALEVDGPRLLERETREDLRRAIGRLPDKKREIVLSVCMIGNTYEEAARATGIPLGTLKRHLRDSLAQLREELAGVVEPSDPIRPAPPTGLVRGPVRGEAE